MTQDLRRSRQRMSRPRDEFLAACADHTRGRRSPGRGKTSNTGDERNEQNRSSEGDNRRICAREDYKKHVPIHRDGSNPKYRDALHTEICAWCRATRPAAGMRGGGLNVDEQSTSYVDDRVRVT